MNIFRWFLAQHFKVRDLFILPPVKIFDGDIPDLQGLIQDDLIFANDFEGLPIVVEQHRAKIAVFLVVPLLKVQIDEYSSTVSSGMSRDTCYLI